MSLLSLTAAATETIATGAAAGSALAVAGGLAGIAGTTLVVGGIVAGFLEVGILSRAHAETLAAAQRSTRNVAEYRAKLANRLRIQQELIEPLRERRARLDAARSRLGLAP